MAVALREERLLRSEAELDVLADVEQVSLLRTRSPQPPCSASVSFVLPQAWAAHALRSKLPTLDDTGPGEDGACEEYKAVSSAGVSKEATEELL